MEAVARAAQMQSSLPSALPLTTRTAASSAHAPVCRQQGAASSCNTRQPSLGPRRRGPASRAHPEWALRAVGGTPLLLGHQPWALGHGLGPSDQLLQLKRMSPGRWLHPLHSTVVRWPIKLN